MIRILKKNDWENIKREPYQQYKDYEKRVINGTKYIPIALNTINELLPSDENYYSGLMRAANLTGQKSLELIIYSYSAGLPVKELADFFPNVIDYWELYAKHHVNFHQSPECDGHLVPHLELLGDEYWEALQLVCFSILFAQPEHLPRIMDILAYENDEQDALLDFLVSPWLPDRPRSYTFLRQLPYRKLKKQFIAKPEQHAELMTTYLDEWYGASRREPYHDRHKSNFFPGYWCLEAAALTIILRIDDSSYRDKPFYPKDLVDFARSHYLDDDSPVESTTLEKISVRGGEPVPKSGYWFTPAKENSRQYFNEGDIFPKFNLNDWGIIHWQWDGEK